MVRLFFALWLGMVSVYAQDFIDDNNTQDPLFEKIKSFLSTESFEQNRKFIEIIFDPKSAYYKNDRVDDVKVIQTLKENGLLDLFFKTPQEITLHLKTNGSPVFFVKIMNDTLSGMGYYKYITIASKRDASEFVWSISFSSEYLTDPLILQKELQKSDSVIVDIHRKSPTEWSYLVDISHARLNVERLQEQQHIQMQRLFYPKWIDVDQVQKVVFKSSNRNSWYPRISFYDSSLHLLKVFKQDKKTNYLRLRVPQTARYMKIADLYTLKNIKDKLELSLKD